VSKPDLAVEAPQVATLVAQACGSTWAYPVTRGRIVETTGRVGRLPRGRLRQAQPRDRGSVTVPVSSELASILSVRGPNFPGRSVIA